MRLIAERPELKKAKPSRLKVAHRKTAHRRCAPWFYIVPLWDGSYPGQCVSVDTTEIRYPLVGQRDRQRRYISTSKSSKRATVLWRLSKACFPCPIERVLEVKEGSSKPRLMWTWHRTGQVVG